MTGAITHAQERRIGRLLLAATGLKGIQPPGLGKRYFIVREWAEAAGGLVRVAIVLRPELIDPQKFGVMVASNHGLVADVFSEEEPAVACLLGDSPR